MDLQLSGRSVSFTNKVVNLNPAQARCTWYTIMWWSLSVICGRSVDFSGYSGFFQQSNWSPRYTWNFVEKAVTHHNPNPSTTYVINWKTKKYYTVETVPNTIKKILERRKIDTSSTQIHDHLLSWLHTITSVKSGDIKLVL